MSTSNNDTFQGVDTLIDFSKKKKNKKEGKQDTKKKEQQEKAINEKNEKMYKELLKRITQTLIKNNPDLAENTKIMLKPPDVIKDGPKKTVIKNFKTLCKQLDRHPEHVMNFFLEDLGGSSGSIGNKGLVIKNALTQKNVQNLFRKYISEFVQCQLCRRQKTQLVKDQKMRLWNIHCLSCKSTRSVRTIKGAEKKLEEDQIEQKDGERKKSEVTNATN